jgi:hypothetical protein
MISGAKDNMFEVHNINVDADSLTDEQVESFEY